MSKKLCVNCFKEIDTTIGGGEICAQCAYNNNTPQIKGALDYYTLLQGRYRLGRVNSQNGEGFTYTAWDANEEKVVDVREFFPATVAYRNENGVFAAEGMEDVFKQLYSEFLEMGRSTVRLRDLGAIIGVTDMFWDNNTCYMVYDHMDSVSLRSFVDSKGGRLDWNEVQQLFIPVISSLSAVHSLGAKHLGISYETLRLCKDGKMRLGDFSIESVRRVGRGIPPELVSGCPAPEQYTDNTKCSEMTDVYALAASMLYALTGAVPPAANKRMENQRLLISRDLLKSLPPHVIRAIAGALQVKQEERIGSFERFRAELAAPATVLSETAEKDVVSSQPKVYKSSAGRHVPVRLWLLGSFIVTGCIVAGILFYIINYTDFSFKKWTQGFSSMVNSELETSYNEVVTVPDMVGDQYRDWQNKVKDTNVYRFKLKTQAQEFNEKIPEGEIISQDPRAGGTIVVGEEVKVVVSRGKAKRALPQIGGAQYARAAELLEREGFQVEKEEAYSESVAAGIVLWYGGDMSTGDEYDYGTKVTVVVSLGKEGTDSGAQGE